MTNAVCIALLSLFTASCAFSGLAARIEARATDGKIRAVCTAAVKYVVYDGKCKSGYAQTVTQECIEPKQIKRLQKACGNIRLGGKP
jgi:hypothetical protein